MDWLRELTNNKTLYQKLSAFLSTHGISGLERAMQEYTEAQKEYFCKTKTSVTRLLISDIYYLQISGHHILVHTENESFQKYGTLSGELSVLAHYGFIKCNQSCAVALSKIKTISNNQIILNNGGVLHMSRGCTHKVLIAFYSYLRK